VIKHRIIFVKNGTPCNWQAQKRVKLFFWEDIGPAFSSATHASYEICDDVHQSEVSAALKRRARLKNETS